MNEPNYSPDSLIVCGNRVLHPVRDRAEIQAWIAGNGPPNDPELVRRTIIEMARQRTATTPTEYVSTTPAPLG